MLHNSSINRDHEYGRSHRPIPVAHSRIQLRSKYSSSVGLPGNPTCPCSSAGTSPGSPTSYRHGMEAHQCFALLRFVPILAHSSTFTNLDSCRSKFSIPWITFQLRIQHKLASSTSLSNALNLLYKSKEQRYLWPNRGRGILLMGRSILILKSTSGLYVAGSSTMQDLC